MEQTPISPAANSSAVRLQGFFELISETFKVYSLRWKTLVALSLLTIALSFVFVLAFVFGGILSGVIYSVAPGAGILAIVVLAILFFLFAIWLSVWLNVAMIIAIRDRRDNIGFSQAMDRAKPLILQYFSVAVAAGIVTIFGYILFIIPGIIFSVWFAFAGFVVLNESERGTSALQKSKAYVSGYFWNVLLLCVLGSLALLAAQMLVSIVPPASWILSIFAVPLPLIYTYLIFERLKEIKKGQAIVLRAREKNFFESFGLITILIIIFLVGLIIYFAPRIVSSITDSEGFKNFQTQQSDRNVGNFINDLK